MCVIRSCLFLAFLPGAVALSAASEAVFQGCANDPTYQYFEKVQFDAYKKSPPEQLKMLAVLRDPQKALELMRQTGTMLNARKDLPGSRAAHMSDAGALEYLRKHWDTKKVPTCYEEPGEFMLWSGYADRIAAATARLKLPLAKRPKLGTLPTTDINAYTFPAAGEFDSVVAFNTQLTMFAWQMTKVTLPTVGVEWGKRVKVDGSPAHAREAIQADPVLRVDFALALTGFIQLTPPETQPIAPSYDSLVLAYAQGMELFAMAHEYGHVIRRHISPAMNFRLGVTDGVDTGSGEAANTVPVLRRSWEQEFEADQIGARLLVDAVANERSSDIMGGNAWIYQARGALFFFKCLQLVEEAKYLRDHGEWPTAATLRERVALRRFVDARASDADKSTLGRLLVGTHPPPWLRLEKVRATLEKEIAKRKPTGSASLIGAIADGMLTNVDLLADAVEPRLRVVIEAAKILKEARATGAAVSQRDAERLAQLAKSDDARGASPRGFRPGCAVAADTWPESFLCGPALEEAVVDLLDGQDDQMIIADYSRAIEEDPLLLSGVQIEWADRVLTAAVPDDAELAVAVMALSGDATFLERIDAFEKTPKGATLTARLASARKFLEAHSRNTSIETATKQALTDDADPTAFLMYPLGISPDSAVAAVTRTTPLANEDQFWEANRRVDPGRSLSLLVARRMRYGANSTETMDSVVDAVLEMGSADYALRLGESTEHKFGPGQSLENTLGNALLQRGSYPEAISHYQKSIELGRADGWPEVNIGSAFDDMNQLDAAERWYRKAFEVKRTSVNPYELAKQLNAYAWFLVQRRRSNPEKIKEAVAISELSNTLSGRQDANLLDTLAECQFAMGHTSEAIQTEHAALERSSPDSKARGEMTARLQKFQEAFKTERPPGAKLPK
jgi:tetratricopeptide (TPR) repeat protein